MNPDPKQIHQKKDLTKCKVNGCLKKGDFKNGICDKCFKSIQKKNKERKRPVKKVSDNSYPKLFKDAKRLFQLLRRIQEADNNGYCVEVHGRSLHYKSCDAGHYMPATYLNTCFDAMNVHPQAKNKNLNMNDPLVIFEYRSFLVKKYGVGEVEKLEIRAKQIKKYSTFELEMMCKDFEKEILKIKDQKGI